MRNTNKKWLVVFGAVLVQLCIGAVYSWSLFNQPLIDKFHWQKNDVIFTFSITIFIFAFTTIFSGNLQDKIGPRKVTMIGGVLYGAGLILTSTATTITQMHIYYGVIGGLGVGFCYVCPLSTCVKWFPAKKGFITGITVGAFGLGSLVFKSVIEFLLNSKGVSETFFYIGIIYLVIIVIGAQFLSTPDEEFSSILIEKNSLNKLKNYTVTEMIKTRSFPLIWIMYLFGSLGGLLIIGSAKDIGVQLAGLSPQISANSVSTIAFFNAGGRLVWGSLSDKLSRLKVIFILFTITGISMFVMSVVDLKFFTFFICIASITFCFGGFLAIFPTITGDFYGTKNLGANYGIIYQAYGLSALIGPFIISNTNNFKTTFIILTILSMLGASLTFLVKNPNKATSKSVQ
ncbi:MAG: OFA family MFS transporter [Clostridium sp.]